jgi:hypothetical protein
MCVCRALVTWFGRGLAGGGLRDLGRPSSYTCAVRAVWPRVRRRWGCMSAGAFPYVDCRGGQRAVSAVRWRGFWAKAQLSSWLGQRRGTPSGGTSLLKASLKNPLLPPLLGRLCRCGSRHWNRAKALLSYCLADDDYVYTSFTSLEASSKRSYALVL